MGGKKSPGSDGSSLWWRMFTARSRNSLEDIAEEYWAPGETEVDELEIEEKFSFTPTSDEIKESDEDKTWSRVLSRAVYTIGSRIPLEFAAKLRHFVGIDDYLIIRDCHGEETSFRLRGGAARPPQFTMKVPLPGESNQVREEQNLDFESDPKSASVVRAILRRLSRHDKDNQPIIFSVRQEGSIWIFRDVSRGVSVEVTVYRIDRFYPTIKTGVYGEVEIIGATSIGDGKEALGHYTQFLDLVGKECSQSIAELFRPSS